MRAEVETLKTSRKSCHEDIESLKRQIAESNTKLEGLQDGKTGLFELIAAFDITTREPDHPKVDFLVSNNRLNTNISKKQLDTRMENVKTAYAENAACLQQLRDWELGTVNKLDEIDEEGDQKGSESFEQRLTRVVASTSKESSESIQEQLQMMRAGVESQGQIHRV